MSIQNYHRFYALLGRLPGADKETLVFQYTGGRTHHLHLMTEAEYRSMCNEMERVAGYDERREQYRKELKRQRSAALHQLQLYGVDTTDWNKVNAFCEQPRIAGKPFRNLDCEELEALTKKMRTIIRKRDKQ